MLSLLFNMNTLWEDYILSELRHVGHKHGVNIIGKEERSIWGANSLEPDIVLVQNKKHYIIDTKWKRPGNAPSPEDTRQMYAYARFWNAERVMLLYPGERLSTFKPFLNEELEERHACKMAFVSILNNSNYELKNDLGKEILESIELL